MKAIATYLACIVIIAILVCFPAAWAMPPLEGRTLDAGQQYTLSLQGATQEFGDENCYDGCPDCGWPNCLPKTSYTPDNKTVTLTLGRTNLGNLMMVFEWTHEPGADVRPDRYVVLLLFDFDNDGEWEDVDGVTNTIDDALGLITLGYDMDVWLGKPWKPSEKWIAFFIPHGLYVYSWNGTAFGLGGGGWDIGKPIGGPPPQGPGPISGEMWPGVKGPGPLYYPSGDPVDFTPFYTTYSGTSYRAEIPVPLGLFHSVCGFGFGIGQQTALSGVLSGQTPWLTWTWPKIPNPVLDNVGARYGAQYLWNLNPDGDGPWNYVLKDPPGPGPVGGFATAVDKIALVAPWIALTAIAGVALVAALIVRRRKV